MTISARITTLLLVLEIAFTIVLFGGAAARAFSLQDIGISAPQSLDVEFIVQNGTDTTTCTGDLMTLFRGNLDQMFQRWLENTARDLLNHMTSQLATRALCAANNWLSKQTVFGYRLNGWAPECIVVQNSDMAETMKQQVRDHLMRNFLVSCITYSQQVALTNTVTAMIQTQGLDGGMAAATDWNYLQNVRPALMAQRQWWALLVNTNICPWFRDDVLDALGVPQSYRDNPPAISALGFAVDERPPFQLRAACTLPADFDISDTSEEAFMRYGGTLFYPELLEAQNDPYGFMEMARAEFEILKAARMSEAQNQLIAGGGFTGTYGECTRDPDGNCLDDGLMQQVPGAVRDIQQADIQSYYDRLNNSSGEQEPLEDIAARLQVRLISLANAPLPLNLALGPASNEANFRTSTPVPAPGSSPTPDPNDPSCTGGDPRCTCVRDNPQYQSLARSAIATAIQSAMQVYPNLFVAGTNQITATNLEVQNAICERIGANLCHPNGDDEIVLDLGTITVSFDIITADGYVRTNGGSPVAACEAGVQ